MLVRFATLAAAALLGLTAFSQSEAPALPGLFGKVTGDYYAPPGGFYRVRIPVLPELGGEIQDTENVVIFDDGVGTHISLACIPLDVSLKWEFETRGTKEFLAFFFANYVATDFSNRFPGAKVEASFYVPDLRDGALLAYMLLPGGSFFENKNSILDTPGDTPAVAKRGNLLFVRDGRVFVVSIELAERVTQKSVFQKTPEQENEILRERLMNFTARIELPSPKPVRKP
ncbi:MAG: hypothetical protein HYV95_01105 [Opitutae bacterium]|nr:hypothetical protein [Opitutae bacterium]